MDLSEIATNLEELARNVRTTTLSAKSTEVLFFSEISSRCQEVCDRLAAWEASRKRSSCVYIVQATDDTDHNECQRSFVKARIAKVGNRAYSRSNDPSRSFYVGSSSSLAKRIREHLGFGHPRTYALHMSQWAGGLDGGVEMQFFLFDAKVKQKVIQAIEDGLWQRYRPMFGRQGAK